MSYYEFSPKVKFELNGKLYKLKLKNLRTCAVFKPLFEDCINKTNDILILSYDFKNYEKSSDFITNIVFDIINCKYERTLLYIGLNPHNISSLLIPIVSFCDYLGLENKSIQTFLLVLIKKDPKISKPFYNTLFSEDFDFCDSVRTIFNVFYEFRVGYGMTRFEKDILKFIKRTNIPYDFKKCVVKKYLYGMLSRETKHQELYVGTINSYGTYDTIHKFVKDFLFDTNITNKNIQLIVEKDVLSKIIIDDKIVLVGSKDILEALLDYSATVFLGCKN